MALAPHSNFLANHETIRYYVGSKFPGHKRFSWGWEDYFGNIFVAKICSSRRIPRYFRKSPRICSSLDSRSLQLLSHGKHNLFPAHSINQNVSKVTFDKPLLLDFMPLLIINYLFSKGMSRSSSVIYILFILFFLFPNTSPLLGKFRKQISKRCSFDGLGEMGPICQNSNCSYIHFVSCFKS